MKKPDPFEYIDLGPVQFPKRSTLEQVIKGPTSFLDKDVFIETSLTIYLERKVAKSPEQLRKEEKEYLEASKQASELSTIQDDIRKAEQLLTKIETSKRLQQKIASIKQDFIEMQANNKMPDEAKIRRTAHLNKTMTEVLNKLGGSEEVVETRAQLVKELKNLIVESEAYLQLKSAQSALNFRDLPSVFDFDDQDEHET